MRGGFLTEGAEVVAHYHRGRERAEALGDLKLVQADLTREDEAERLFEEAGELAVCAAVAGVWPSEDAPVWSLPLERWEQTLRENLTSTFLTARGSFARSSGRAAEAWCSSARRPASSARRATPTTRRRSRRSPRAPVEPEKRDRPDRPGGAGQLRLPRLDENADGPAEVDDPEVIDRVTRTMALRKIALPEDVARQVVVLSSDELSGHVTGQIVVVAGGMEGRTLH